MNRLGRTLGRRGAMLLTLGLTYVALGYGVGTRPVLWVEGSFVTYLPQFVPAAGWVLSGLVACVAAWRRWDTIGWLALYVVPAVYLVSYAGSWLLWQITANILPALAYGIMWATSAAAFHVDLRWWLIDPPYGDASAWYNALLRVPFLAIVLICSGWRETHRHGAGK